MARKKLAMSAKAKPAGMPRNPMSGPKKHRAGKPRKPSY